MGTSASKIFYMRSPDNGTVTSSSILPTTIIDFTIALNGRVGALFDTEWTGARPTLMLLLLVLASLLSFIGGKHRARPLYPSLSLPCRLFALDEADPRNTLAPTARYADSVEPSSLTLHPRHVVSVMPPWLWALGLYHLRALELTALRKVARRPGARRAHPRILDTLSSQEAVLNSLTADGKELT